MRRHHPVKADKVASIKRQDGSTTLRSKGEDRLIFDSLVCLPDLLSRHNIVAKLAQALHHGITEICIGIEPGHGLHVLDLLQGPVDVLTMSGIIGPSDFQIRRR